jgi:hypothetical protein|tara:strand:- start:1851 stop:2075 length:225 start_codon:yes stop_codon:yes gene_type:complete
MSWKDAIKKQQTDEQALEQVRQAIESSTNAKNTLMEILAAVRYHLSAAGTTQQDYQPRQGLKRIGPKRGLKRID